MKNLSAVVRTAGLVGRTPRSAADATVGLLAPCKMLISLPGQRDEGVRPQKGSQDPGVRPTKPRGVVFSTFSHVTVVRYLNGGASGGE